MFHHGHVIDQIKMGFRPKISSEKIPAEIVSLETFLWKKGVSGSLFRRKKKYFVNFLLETEFPVDALGAGLKLMLNKIYIYKLNINFLLTIYN